MEAKVVKTNCPKCQQPIEVDFNVCDFSSEISVVNGKKTERRFFVKQCPNCGHLHIEISENKEEWGNRKGTKMKTVMFSGGFSCLVTIIIIVAVAYFAIKGILTIFNWIF